MTIDEALKSGTARLAAADVLDPRREAASLVGYAVNRQRSFLIAHPEYELSPAELAALESVLLRRENREPFQYITGKQEFWGLDFSVAPGVLIPRPETEILVEAAIEVLRPLQRPTFVEAGVGSGCISISILHSVPTSSAIATDLSDTALALTASNAHEIGVAHRLELRKADLFGGVAGNFDLVVSNPPYIPDRDVLELQAEVRDFEPHSALAGGPDGLDIVRRIVADARHILRCGGVLMLEIGAGQAAAVEQLFDLSIWEAPGTRYDLQAIARVITARLRS